MDAQRSSGGDRRVDDKGHRLRLNPRREAGRAAINVWRRSAMKSRGQRCILGHTIYPGALPQAADEMLRPWR